MISEDEENEERSHWIYVCDTILAYKSKVISDMQKRQEHLNRLPKVYASRLPNVTLEQMWSIDQVADHNQAFFEDVNTQ